MPPPLPPSPRIGPPRIRRTQQPPGKLKNWNLRNKALPFLRIDFEDRCAYSRQHVHNAGGIEQMEVDHFDPAKKKDFWQKYENLYLAKSACNNKKQAGWPTPAQQAVGVRFLDPCAETDYGVHIFEDPVTHKLWGSTPAGRYHVRVLGLNMQHLVDDRRERAELRKAFTEMPARIIRDPDENLQQTLEQMRLKLERGIPAIEFRPEPP